MTDPSLIRFRRVVAAGVAELERRRTEVNDLNVFPVADGDTGDNMAMTMRSVLAVLDELAARPSVSRTEIVEEVARAALLGARGNSGVILSQIVRGAAEELASRPGELVDPMLVAASFARAADAAYDSVRDPAEGTMLSAIRAMASRVTHDVAHVESERLGPDASDADQDAVLAEFLEGALESAKEALERGPEQLAVLREAGVVDAGAYGLAIVMAGVVAALRGEEQPDLEHQPPPVHVLHLPEHESSEYRYCTNFAVTGQALHGPAFVPRLERLGDSVLVVGDERTLRVHVHTDDPEGAVAVFDGAGEVSRFDVADMREQVAARTARLAEAPEVRCGVLAVASGEGVRRLFESFGALVVTGGETANPSVYELLAGIHSAPAREVIVLPNDPNVILAAELAAERSEKPARVVPTRSPQEALAALVAHDADASVEANAEAIAAAAAAVATGGVARAARDDVDGRFRAGDAIGYAGGELVAWGTPEETLSRTLDELARGRELLTAIAGDGAPLGRDALAAAVPDGVELDYHEGGQPAWWWLFCAE